VKEIRITITSEPPAGAFEGDSAAVRDPLLLRSQLEPWSTTTLRRSTLTLTLFLTLFLTLTLIRRRLVADFGRPATDPESVDRGGVMSELLECYAEEGMCSRKLVRVEGTPVGEDVRGQLLMVMKEWAGTNKSSGANRERPTIKVLSQTD